MRPVVRWVRRALIVAVAGASVIAGAALAWGLGWDRMDSARRVGTVAALVFLPPAVIGALLIDRRALKRSSVRLKRSSVR